mgnify:CR=1 FL=1
MVIYRWMMSTDEGDDDRTADDGQTLWPADVLGAPRYPGEFDVTDSPPAASPPIRQVLGVSVGIGVVVGIGVALLLTVRTDPRAYPPATPTVTVTPVSTSAAAAVTTVPAAPATGRHQYCPQADVPDRSPKSNPGETPSARTPGADRSPNAPGVDSPARPCGGGR